MAIRTPATFETAARRRALAERAARVWPRLDPRVISASGGDPRTLARYLARRTILPYETILAMLEPECAGGEAAEREG